jgi:hypothetical protein
MDIEPDLGRRSSARLVFNKAKKIKERRIIE